jgi:hypothetical protein
LVGWTFFNFCIYVFNFFNYSTICMYASTWSLGWSPCCLILNVSTTLRERQFVVHTHKFELPCQNCHLRESSYNYLFSNFVKIKSSHMCVNLPMAPTIANYYVVLASMVHNKKQVWNLNYHLSYLNYKKTIVTFRGGVKKFLVHLLDIFIVILWTCGHWEKNIFPSVVCKCIVR